MKSEEQQTEKEEKTKNEDIQDTEPQDHLELDDDKPEDAPLLENENGRVVETTPSSRFNLSLILKISIVIVWIIIIILSLIFRKQLFILLDVRGVEI